MLGRLLERVISTSAKTIIGMSGKPPIDHDSSSTPTRRETYRP